jgi:hypothetical protein
MTIPSVKDFFAQYAEKGHIFPAPGLRVRLRNRIGDDVMMISPQYAESELRIYGDNGGARWGIGGRGFGIAKHEWILRANPDYDIIAILDESGNVVAGEG